mgnify:FL=1
MSQKTRLEILRCVVLVNFFSKKRNFWFKKTRPLLPETILNYIADGETDAKNASVEGSR